MSETKAAVTPPPGVKVPTKVEKAPAADRVDPTAPNGGTIEGAPAPMLNTAAIKKVDKPVHVEAEEKELGWVQVYIDLGQSADKIRINEIEFHHGQIATVREDLLPVLNEVMYNTKMHERVVRGEVSPSGKRLQAGRR